MPGPPLTVKCLFPTIAAVKRRIIHSSEEMVALGEEMASELNPGTVIGLEGPLGAGKTTFVKGIARGLGIIETVTSPTFTLVTEYEGKLPLYHMDLYRIRSSEEFEFLGVWEMLYGDGITVIEWCERAADALPRGSLRVTISIVDGSTRSVVIREADE